MSGELLWEPAPESVAQSGIAGFERWLSDNRDLRFADYGELWKWSTTDLEGFWSAIWDHFEVVSSVSYREVIGDSTMPGSEWFPGARLNYAENVFRDRGLDGNGRVAVVYGSERAPVRELTWTDLRAQVSSLAAGLRQLGIESGDRVAAYIPNVPESVIAFLAAASIGAIWSSCSPDFGARTVIDRFSQITPKVLIASEGYEYGGKHFDRSGVVADLVASIPSIETTVLVGDSVSGPGRVTWDDLLSEHRGAQLEFEQVESDHPLWVLYSSGTTGLPKAIVQSHSGILLEHLKTHHLHLDLQADDRYFWFTTTGWMMWNFLVSGLLTEASIVQYDGNPGYPDLSALWQFAADAGITVFGTSASFIASCMKEGVIPAEGRDLSGLRALGSTGSPLVPEGFDWIYEHLGRDLHLFSASGGTDVCTAFIGGVPVLPVYRGELQARALGCALESWNEEGQPVIGEVGELVITKPLPSMPIFFWGDDQDMTRYRESYFELFPGTWRHGDWIEITDRGTGVIYGRSDSTINRGGIRMGTSEIYRAVLSIPEINDAIVVDIPRPNTDGWMILFVVLGHGAENDQALQERIASLIRRDCSPRHVPNEVFEIEEVPRTLTGKILEVPVKKILMGMPVDQAASRDSLANPGSLEYFERMAVRTQSSR